MAPLKLTFRWEGGRGRRFNFSLPRHDGDLRGEVDDSAGAPLYAVQHCVVDTYDGRIVLAPTNNEEGAEELAGRLNGFGLQPPRPKKKQG